MDLRIALCGAPGAGKTRLAKALSQRLTLPLIYQGTKELRAISGPAKTLPPFYKMNEVQRALYQVELIKYREGIERLSTAFVADGTALDMLAWYRLSCWLIPFDQKMATFELLTQMTLRYTHIFYIPYEAPPPPPTSEEENLTAVDPFNILTADLVLKGVVAFMVHSAKKPVYIIETPSFVTSTSPDVDNVQASTNLRVEEILKVVMGDPVPPGASIQ